MVNFEKSHLVPSTHLLHLEESNRFHILTSIPLIKPPGKSTVLSGKDHCSAVGAFEPPLAALGEDDFVPSESALGVAACHGSTMVYVSASESRKK